MLCLLVSYRYKNRWKNSGGVACAGGGERRDLEAVVTGRHFVQCVAVPVLLVVCHSNAALQAHVLALSNNTHIILICVLCNLK